MAAKRGWYDGHEGRDGRAPTKAVMLPFASGFGENPVPIDEEQAYWDAYGEGRDAKQDETNPYAATPNVEPIGEASISNAGLDIVERLKEAEGQVDGEIRKTIHDAWSEILWMREAVVLSKWAVEITESKMYVQVNAGVTGPCAGKGRTMNHETLMAQGPVD